MAERLDDINQEININVNANGADQAANSIDRLNVNIEETTRSTNQNTTANRQATSASNQLSRQTRTTDASMNDLGATFEEVYGELQPLTTRMGEAEDRLYELALAGDRTSDEFQGLLQTVSNYRRTQIEVDRVVDASAATLGERLGGAAQIATAGISAVTSASALFGEQSEETEKALLKVQAAMAFADSISSLSQLQGQFTVFKDLVVSGYQRILVARRAELAATEQQTIAQRILNITALANPYIAVAAAVTALVAVTYIWIKSSREQAKILEVATSALNNNKNETESLSKAIEDNNTVTEASNTIEVARAKALGASDAEIQKLIQSQKELAVSTAFAFNKEAYNNLLKAQQATFAAIKTGNEDLVKDAEDNEKKAREIYERSNEAFGDAIVAEAENRLTVQADALQKAREAAAKAAEERKKLAEDERKRLNDEANEAGRLAEERYAKDIRDYVNFRLALTEAKVQADRDEADRINESLAEITKEEDARLLERVEAEKRIDDYRLQLKEYNKQKEMEIAEGAVSLFSILAGKSKKLQKAALIAEGSVGVAKTVQNTFTGNAAALSQGIVQAGPILGPPLAAPAIALNTIQGGISVAGTVAATAKGLSAIGEGGSVNGSTGATSAGGSGGTAPTRNVAQVGFQGSSENQIANAVAASQKNQPPIEAFVVSQSMTDQQELDRKKELNNSF